MSGSQTQYIFTVNYTTAAGVVYLRNHVYTTAPDSTVPTNDYFMVAVASGAPPSTGGTTTVTGGAGSTGGTNTVAGGGSTSGSTTGTGSNITLSTSNGVVNIVSGGVTYTALNATPAQLLSLTVGTIQDAQGRINIPVVGDVSNATINGTMTASQAGTLLMQHSTSIAGIAARQVTNVSVNGSTVQILGPSTNGTPTVLASYVTPAGTAGLPGSSVTPMSAVPASSAGNNGDSAIITTTGELYTKVAGVWTDAGASLRGPAGGAGTPGPAGASGLQGTAGQGFNFRNAWTPNTSYSAYDVVTNGGNTYHVTTPFTSGATFSTTNLALFAAAGAAGAAGAQGPAGTLGSGDVSGNVAAGASTGPSRALSAFLATLSVSPANYGAFRNVNGGPISVNSVIGQVTRAGIAAWKAPSGNTPYAFVASQPFPDGTADYRIHVPPVHATNVVAIGGTTANPTVDLHSHVKLTMPGYTGTDGHFYLPIPGLNPAIATGQTVSGGVTNANAGTTALASGTTVTALDINNSRIQISAQATGTTTGGRVSLTIGSLSVNSPSGSYYDGTNWWVNMPPVGEAFIYGMNVSGVGIAAGSKVICTYGNVVRITDQPSGTSVPAGTVVDFGADMTKVTTGLFIHTAEGTTALSSITAVNGSVITLSAPLTSGQTYGNTLPYNGIRSMVRMTFYKSIAPDATLGNVLNMDTLAYAAAHYACPYSGGIETEPGTLYLQNLILTGGNVSHRFKKGVVLQGGTGGVMITSYPQPGSEVSFESSHIFNSGLQDSAFECDGTQYSWYVQNTANGTDVNIKDNISFGYFVDHFRIQNLGASHYDGNEVFGAGKNSTVTNSACRLSNVVLLTFKSNNFHGCPVGLSQPGYIEDGIGEDNAFDNCGRGYDQEISSTYNGYTSLIFKWRGGDDDCINNTLYLKHTLEPIITGCEVSASGGKDAYVLAGCNTGIIADLEGGTGSNTGACVHLTTALKDYSLNAGGVPVGNVVGSSQINTHDIEVNGFAQALLIDAGCNNNPRHNIRHNGSVANAVVDNGSGNTDSTGSNPISITDPNVDLFVGAINQQNVGTSVSSIAVNPSFTPSAWNGSAYVTLYAGIYRMDAEPFFADTGTAAVAPVAASGSTAATPGYNAAPPSGTRFFVQFTANGGVLASIPITTQPKSTSGQPYYYAYIPAGVTLNALIYGDVAGLLNGGQVSYRCVCRTA